MRLDVAVTLQRRDESGALGVPGTLRSGANARNVKTQRSLIPPPASLGPGYETRLQHGVCGVKNSVQRGSKGCFVAMASVKANRSFAPEK